MQICDLPTPEKFDLMIYDQLAWVVPQMREKGGESMKVLANMLEAERPTVLAVAFYDPITGGKADVMVLTKWNDEIYEYGLCEFVPYCPFLKTNDTSVKSVWELIGKFTDKSRQAGARTLMIRAELPKE